MNESTARKGSDVMKSKKFPVGTGGGRHPERIEAKRQEANDRNDVWNGMSAREQIASLDHRLGKGIGAGRQRARLAKSL